MQGVVVVLAILSLGFYIKSEENYIHVNIYKNFQTTSVMKSRLGTH